MLKVSFDKKNFTGRLLNKTSMEGSFILRSSPSQIFHAALFRSVKESD